MQHGPNRPTQGEQIAHAEWVADAVRLALKGWTARKIAKKLGLHHSTVSDALNEELGRVRVAPEEVERLRATMREQIQDQLAAWIPRSLGKVVDGVRMPGCKDAGLVVFRFMERAAKLDGLDAPEKSALELSGSVAEATPTDAARLVREAFGSRAAKSDNEPGEVPPNPPEDGG